MQSFLNSYNEKMKCKDLSFKNSYIEKHLKKGVCF